MIGNTSVTTKWSERPDPPPDIESSSCDWGQCNQQGEFWRWELRMRVWLPVCPRHALKADREREVKP